MLVDHGLMFTTLGGYALATVWSELGVVAPNRFRTWVSTVLVALGMVAHTIALSIIAARTGRLPMANLYEVLSLFLWFAVALFLALQLWRPLRAVGAFYLPLVTAVAAGVAALAGQSAIDTRGRSIIVVIHGGTALLGFAAFALAAAVAVMFLIQDGLLKRHSTGRLGAALSSVSQLEGLTYVIVGFGFISLTISLGLGIYIAGQTVGEWATQHTALLSIATWLVFAVLFHVRLTSAWRGRKAAWLTVVGFAVVAAVFAVLLFTADTLHGFLG